jgi:hypothetical protein
LSAPRITIFRRVLGEAVERHEASAVRRTTSYGRVDVDTFIMTVRAEAPTSCFGKAQAF